MIRRSLSALGVAAVLGCSSAPPPGPVTNITVSTGTLVPAFSPDVFVYEATALTSLVPVDVTVTGQDVTIDGEPAKDGVAHPTSVATLDDATEIRIDATDAKGAPVTYNIRSVPKVRPQWDVTALDSPTPGLILVSPTQLVGPTTTGPSMLYILDETGTLVYYAKTPFDATDFERVTLPNGLVRYTYLMQDAPLDWSKWPIEPTTAYVMDDHFRPLQTIRLSASGTHDTFGLDVHEFRLLDDDHWISESYLSQAVTNVPGYATSTVVDAIVQEVSGGNVVFDWGTTSVPSLYTDSTDGNDFTDAKTPYADYTHLNSVDVNPSNGNLLVSLRHDDELIELDRATGAVVWTFGGASDQFGLAAADKPSHQHHARFVAPNDITMFDNGNASQVTKLREYQIDPVGHTAQVVAALPLDGHYTSAMGSLQKYDGRYFVGWGFRRDGESDITELDATTQKKSFELSFRDGYVSYRALKFSR